MSSTLNITLTSSSWDPGTQHAAVAEVVPRGGTKRTTLPPSATFALKVNQAPYQLALEPGDYTVRVYLPSGDILTDSVSFPEEQAVSFALPESPHEWLGQEQLIGSIQRLPNIARMKALEGVLTAKELKDEIWGKLKSVVRARSDETDDSDSALGQVRERTSYALRDIARVCDSIDRNSGASRVASIQAERFVTQTDRDRPFPDTELPFDQLVEWWTGPPGSDGNTLRLADHDERNAKWICPDPPKSYLSGRPRALASMLDPNQRKHVAVLPEGWVCSSEASYGRATQTSLLMTVVISSVLQTGDEQIEPVRWSCSTAVDDVEFMTYLGFLYSGQSSAANTVLTTQGMDLLFEKGTNPVAAAAGAYGLLSFPVAERSLGRSDWRKWVRNLSTRYPDLPDGAIALARMYVRYGDEDASEHEDIDVEKLRGYLLEAVRRGLPFFTMGVNLLSEMLSLVTGDDEANKRTGDAVDLTRRAHRLVNQLGRVAVPGKLFTVLSTRRAPS